MIYRQQTAADAAGETTTAGAENTQVQTAGAQTDRAMADLRDREDIVALMLRDDGSWLFHMTAPLRAAGIGPGDQTLSDIVADDGNPLLVISAVEADGDNDEGDEGDEMTRAVTGDPQSMQVRVRPAVIESAPRAGGLGVDPDAYDNDNPLLFQTVPDPEGSLLGLEPLGYESDIAAQAERDEQTGAGTDATSEGDVEEGSHAVDERAVAAAAEVTGVDRSRVEGALLAVAQTLADADVRGEVVTPAPGYDPLTVGERSVEIVTDETWPALQTRIGFEDDVREAVRIAHTQTAEDLVVDHGDASYRRFSRERSAIVRESD